MRLFNLRNIQFSQILSDIQQYLANRSTGPVKSINKNTVFGQLMTVISAVAHNIYTYIEDAFTEQNKYSAQRKKSVLALAAQSGYRPSYGKSTGLWIQMSHKANNRAPLDVIIPDHQRLLCSSNGLYYNLVLDQDAITIRTDVHLAPQRMYAVQGKFENQVFVSNGGGELYSQNIQFIGYIDTDYLVVRVNGEEWTQKSSLYDLEANEKAYYWQYNPVSGLDLMFGNGPHGKPLEDNDRISVSYLLHDGESGNLETVDSNTLFLFDSPLKDVSGEEVDGNTCFDVRLSDGQESIASGADPESITYLRRMIGFNTRSLVLSDSNAYKAFLSRFSFVGYNRTWTEPGSLLVKSLVLRNYKQDMAKGSDYFSLKTSQFVLSDLQKSSIQNALQSSGCALAGTTYEILEPEICKYAMYLYIKPVDSSVLDPGVIRQQIREVVGNFFGDIPSDMYIPKSDIIQLIKNNVEGIDGVTCYILSERNETALQERRYQEVQHIYDPVSGTYKDKTITVSLYPNENPQLGLDAHGNILLSSDYQFPVLAGGWDYLNSAGQEVTITDPLTIVFEN